MSNDFAPLVAAYQAAEDAVRKVEAEAASLQSTTAALRESRDSLNAGLVTLDSVSQSTTDLGSRIIDLSDALRHTVDVLSKLEPDRLANIVEATRSAVSELEDAVKFVGTEQRDLGTAASAARQAALSSMLSNIRGLQEVIRAAISEATERVVARNSESTTAVHELVIQKHEELLVHLTSAARRQVTMIVISTAAAVAAIGAIVVGLLP